MKHYKLIENRPELTQAQVLQGMNFAAIQNGAVLPGKALVKTTAAKTVLLKTVISIVVLTSSVFVYKEFNQSPKENKQEILLADSSGNKLNKDTLVVVTAPAEYTVKPHAKAIVTEAIKPEEKTVLPIVPFTDSKGIEEPVAVTKNEEIKDPVTVKQEPVTAKPERPFKASPNVTCTIWNTSSFCNMPVKRDPSSISMQCDNCEFNFISCKELDKQPGVKAVWLVISVAKKGEFKIKTAFKNFRLVRNTGEVINPVAIGVGTGGEEAKEPKFFSSDFKTKKLDATFKKQIDIFLFFDNPKPGDKIFIDDFIQTVIKE
ncbi:MAG: hypothetical protein ACXVNM_12165 [Bacteroidia bacterium]